MNGICATLNRYYGAVAADDCESSWSAVKVDRAGNMVILQEGFDTEEAADEFAAGICIQDRWEAAQRAEAKAQREHASALVSGVAVTLFLSMVILWAGVIGGQI